jgi:hypothetical protein
MQSAQGDLLASPGELSAQALPPLACSRHLCGPVDLQGEETQGPWFPKYDLHYLGAG